MTELTQHHRVVPQTQESDSHGAPLGRLSMVSSFARCASARVVPAEPWGSVLHGSRSLPFVCVPLFTDSHIDAISSSSSRDQCAEQDWRCRGSAIPRVWEGVGVCSMFDEPPTVLRAGGSDRGLLSVCGRSDRTRVHVAIEGIPIRVEHYFEMHCRNIVL